MSKFLLTLLITFSCFLANAQFKKGDVLAGGTLSYSSTKSTMVDNPDDQKSNTGNFNISLGKALKENTVFGVNISYQPHSVTSGSGANWTRDRTDGYGISIFYRMYRNLGKEFYLFGEAGGGYIGSTSSLKDRAGDKLSTGTSSGGQIYVTPGIAYKISSKFFLELSIPQIFSAAYTSAKTKSGSAVTASSDDFSIGANINSNPLNSLGIGFRLIL
jgi:hypothetical protein